MIHNLCGQVKHCFVNSCWCPMFAPAVARQTPGRPLGTIVNSNTKIGKATAKPSLKHTCTTSSIGVCRGFHQRKPTPYIICWRNRAQLMTAWLPKHNYGFNKLRLTNMSLQHFSFANCLRFAHPAEATRRLGGSAAGRSAMILGTPF